MISLTLPFRIRVSGVLTLVLAAALVGLSAAARAQEIRSEEEIARIIALDKVAVQDGVVTGEIRNKASHLVRDVQLLIRYTWLWDDEFKPGKNDPGTSTYHVLKETIPSGATRKFTYQPSPPLAKMAGGHFDTTVKIAGFTEIIPQK